MMVGSFGDLLRKAFVDGFKVGPFTVTFGHISGFRRKTPLHDRSEAIETARSAFERQRLRR